MNSTLEVGFMVLVVHAVFSLITTALQSTRILDLSILSRCSWKLEDPLASRIANLCEIVNIKLVISPQTNDTIVLMGFNNC